MMGAFLLFPDEYLRSAYEIDYRALYAKGYRGIIFDIDNTLVGHNAPADRRAVHLIAVLKDIGFSVNILSNNKEPRVKSFAGRVRADDYLFLANKPLPKGYKRAMRRMGLKRDQMLVIGDQLFTDICGANLAGMHTILVEPVKKWHEEIQIIFKRLLEAPILFAYKKIKFAK